MKTACLIIALSLLATSLPAQDTSILLETRLGEPGAIDISLRKEASAAIQRGLDWLEAQQNENGHWSNEYFPALTALPVWALVEGNRNGTKSVIAAIKYLKACAQENGAIFRESPEDRKGGGLSTYNTALCMVALHKAGDPSLMPLVVKAREFIAGNQHLGGDMYRGGMGYDPSTGRPYADLSNSYLAYEAMRLTEDAEDFRKDSRQRADLDWSAATDFLARVQNRPGASNQPWASNNPGEQGGFIYRPDQSKAGTFTDDDGIVRFRTYGSMTYAGLLSLIYARVDRKDPRVRSAFHWAEKHWSLNENPGMGQAGLYYFYNVLSKSLSAVGRDQLSLSDGKTINWRNELIRKLLSLQKIDPGTGHGYWLNENGRWWETDPVLITSYALVALETALR